LILIDDGSHNPCTFRTLLYYQQLDPRIRVILNHVNLGYPFGPILGFTEAKGELVTLMDDDEIMHPTKLEKQVQEFIKDPEMGWVASHMSHIDR